MSVLAIINFRKIKSEVLAHATFLLTSVAIFAFLVNGLYVLSDLRESYLNPSDYFNTGVYHLMIRYMSFLFLALALLMCSKYIKQSYVKPNYRVVFDILLHITLLWVLSSELIHWMDIFGSEQSYKLGLSILWGLYSFVLITFGILKTKQYLRIGGIGLFGITLVKLFFYDIVHLNTISKTIVFVSLGVLLLIISFLYNKYKNHISDDTKN